MPASYNASEEVADLRNEVSQLKQELRAHRKVLEECLQVREGCAELLTHREALTQILELREGAQQPGQTMLGSDRLDRIEIRVMEGLEHQGEMDLSLAGVSENTAKQGMAISALMEQQKCTAATLDAVVRAVKRLDRSRSRPRGLTTETLSAGHYAEGSVYAGDMEQSEPGAAAYDVRRPPPGSASNASLHASAQGGGDPDAGGSDCPAGPLQQDGACDYDVQQQSQDGAEAHPDDQMLEDAPVEDDGRDWSDAEAEGAPDVGCYGGTGGSDAWDWRGWGRECNDQDDSRYASACSSCGSDGRSRNGAWPRTGSAGRQRRGGPFPRGGYPRALRTRSFSGRGAPGRDRWTGEFEHDFSASGRSRSVLARIEEALTKLDDHPRQHGRFSGFPPDPYDPGCLASPQHCAGRAGSARGRACRPPSAATPRQRPAGVE